MWFLKFLSYVIWFFFGALFASGTGFLSAKLITKFLTALTTIPLLPQFVAILTGCFLIIVTIVVIVVLFAEQYTKFFYGKPKIAYYDHNGAQYYYDEGVYTVLEKWEPIEPPGIIVFLQIIFSMFMFIFLIA